MSAKDRDSTKFFLERTLVSSFQKKEKQTKEENSHWETKEKRIFIDAGVGI